VNPLVRGVAAALSALPFMVACWRGRSARSEQRWQHLHNPEIWPSVSVIIPAWCERGTLEACLAAVRQLDYPEYEIIVAAGGPDGTLEAAMRLSRRDPRIRIVPQRPTAGKNGAMNDAVRAAAGEALVFLDADGLVSPSWLKALVAGLGPASEARAYAASTGRFVSARRTLIARAGEMSQVLEYESRGRVSLQGSGSMALWRTAWDVVGELPEGPYADDWDLNARLRHADLAVSYAPNAIVLTERPHSLAQWWSNELRWRRIHLGSLLRVARAEMPDSAAAARSLYPYIAGWAFVAFSAAALMGRLLPRASRISGSLWCVVAAPALSREVAGVVETAVYTGDPRWLSVALVTPALTVLGWIAAVIASLTVRRAPIHFKGPRQWSPRLAQHATLLDEEAVQAAMEMVA
jgi:glycosyltransferase involved in cell wall biosynthesis